MTTIARRVLLAGIAATVLSGALRAQEPATTILSVPGRTNSAPWIAAQGRFVAVTWAAAAGSASDIFVATSRDEGATFSAPVQVNRVAGDGRVGGEIPPRVALHARTGSSEPDVVVAWNAKERDTGIKVARSSDGGRSFGEPVSLQSPGAPGDRGWHALALDDQGTAHVLWLDHRGLAEARAGSGGAKAGEHQHKGEHDGVAMAQKSGLYYATFGARASADREVTPGVCYCCKSAIVALRGGRLVSAWRHVYADNMRDIAFTVSRDGGRTFAAPARVSEDGWSINGCPDDGPALSADADAGVHIVWPTVIPGDDPQGALFYAPMQASGRFAARVRIPTLGSPKPSHPQVAVDGAGRLFVAWDEVLDGVRAAAFTAGVAGADGTVRFGAPQRLAATGPTLYPVMAPLAQGVIAAWTAGAPGSSVIQVRRLASPAAMSTTAAPAPAPAQVPAPMQGHQPPPGADHMQHRFDDPEAYAKSFDDPARDGWQMPSRVIDALALKPGQIVADVGAGTGYFSTRLARAVAKPTVFAVDIEPAMVAHLTRRAANEGLANMRAVQASASSPNLPEPVDIVLVVDTFHHIGNRAAYFAGVRARLRPGGRVAVIDFRKDAPGEGPPAHFRFTPEQITADMEAAGFVIEARHDFLPRQHFLVYRVR